MCEGASKQTPDLKILPHWDPPLRFEIPGSATGLLLYSFIEQDMWIFMWRNILPKKKYSHWLVFLEYQYWYLYKYIYCKSATQSCKMTTLLHKALWIPSWGMMNWPVSISRRGSTSSRFALLASRLWRDHRPIFRLLPCTPYTKTSEAALIWLFSSLDFAGVRWCKEWSSVSPVIPSLSSLIDFSTDTRNPDND